MKGNKLIPAMRVSLPVGIVILLTIALLPLGLIAVYQTVRVVNEAEDLAQRDVLARTGMAANAELALIRRAHGAALALATAAVGEDPASQACSSIMRRFVEADDRFILAGFVEPDGMMRCMSRGEPTDFSQAESWQEFKADPRPTTSVSRAGAVTGQSVMIVSVPLFDDAGELAGAGVVSIPNSLTDILLAVNVDNVDVALINSEGEVLSASSGLENAEAFEELGIHPRDYVLPANGEVLNLELPDGDEVSVAIVPLVGERLFIVGRWAEASEPSDVTALETATPVFPVVMWLTGLVVAFLAIDRLVLRYLKTLRRQMKGFSAEQGVSRYVTLPDAPIEFRQIASSYNTMIDRIVADRDQLEAALREKEILVKEVHHRVKNNLQLIASILNMQLRSIESEDARRVLRRVQDRVMSLATIHKSLYSDTTVETVRVDRLLSEIVNGLFNLGVSGANSLDTDIDLSPVSLDADQAVPLSLLVNEAVTNAVKYAGSVGGARPKVGVALSETADGTVTLVVTNTRGARPGEGAEMDSGTGLGSRLIQAFVSQLGGTFEVADAPEHYGIRVTFRKLGAEPEEAAATG